MRPYNINKLRRVDYTLTFIINYLLIRRNFGNILYDSGDRILIN